MEDSSQLAESVVEDYSNYDHLNSGDEDDLDYEQSMSEVSSEFQRRILACRILDLEGLET